MHKTTPPRKQSAKY